MVTKFHRPGALGGEIPERRRLEVEVAEGIPSLQAQIQVALGERDGTHVGEPETRAILGCVHGRGVKVLDTSLVNAVKVLDPRATGAKL